MKVHNSVLKKSIPPGSIYIGTGNASIKYLPIVSMYMYINIGFEHASSHGWK